MLKGVESIHAMTTKPANQAGSSLIEILVVVAVMSVVMMAMATMQSNQAREMAAMSQKLASLDVERVISQALSNSALCTNMLININPSQPAFNPANLPNAQPAFVALTTIPASGDPAAIPLLTLSDPLSPLNSQLFAQSIMLTNLNCSSTCSPTTSSYSAQLTVTFKQNLLIRTLRPLIFPITLQTSGAAGNQSIVSCTGTSSGGGTGGTGSSGLSAQDICTLINSTLDPTTGICKSTPTCTTSSALPTGGSGSGPKGTCDYSVNDGTGNMTTISGVQVCTGQGWMCFAAPANSSSSGVGGGG